MHCVMNICNTSKTTGIDYYYCYYHRIFCVLYRHTRIISLKTNSIKDFSYRVHRLAEYLGWSNQELVGQSVFEFYHALDNLALDKCFKCRKY